MQQVIKVLQKEVAKGLETLFDYKEPEKLQFQETRKEFEGEITLVTFPLAKKVKSNPQAVAEKLGEYLKDHAHLVANFNVVKGFLNLVLIDEYWLESLNDALNSNTYGIATEPSGKSIMVEYSSPNTNKPLHLGHLRNNFLGYSVAEILKANGHKVLKVQIINDRGIHICKSMLAWQLFGDGETPETAGMKGDKLVGKYYVLFDKKYREEQQKIYQNWQEAEDVSSLISKLEADKIIRAPYEKEAFEKFLDQGKDALSDKESTILKLLADRSNKYLLGAQDLLRKWEQEEPKVRALWEKMNGWVYDGFNATYQAMGVNFDKLYYESETYLKGRNYVKEGKEKELFYAKEDGSVWVDLEDEGLDHKLLLRGDGTAVYMTQDIGTAVQRYEDVPDLNQIVYTVGNEQDYHFQVLFKVLEKMGYAWAKNCYHLSYGMVDLPSGKMKSREGTVVDADDLIEEMRAEAKRISEELGKLDASDTEALDALYSTVGLGALKYHLLKVDPKKRMMFDPQESIDFTGHTGPFIQYTYARIQSILDKASATVTEINTDISLLPEEKACVVGLSHFPAVVKEAGENYNPAVIANYLYDLVKLYNAFYQNVSILKEENNILLSFRVALSKKVGEVIKTGMALLGIQVPDKM